MCSPLCSSAHPSCPPCPRSLNNSLKIHYRNLNPYSLTVIIKQLVIPSILPSQKCPKAFLPLIVISVVKIKIFKQHIGLSILSLLVLRVFRGKWCSLYALTICMMRASFSLIFINWLVSPNLVDKHGRLLEEGSELRDYNGWLFAYVHSCRYTSADCCSM